MRTKLRRIAGLALRPLEHTVGFAREAQGGDPGQGWSRAANRFQRAVFLGGAGLGLILPPAWRMLGGSQASTTAYWVVMLVPATILGFLATDLLSRLAAAGVAAGVAATSALLGVGVLLYPRAVCGGLVQDCGGLPLSGAAGAFGLWLVICFEMIPGIYLGDGLTAVLLGERDLLWGAERVLNVAAAVTLLAGGLLKTATFLVLAVILIAILALRWVRRRRSVPLGEAVSMGRPQTPAT